MPKIKSKINAQFTARIGKTPVTISFPVSLDGVLADSTDAKDAVAGLIDQAAQELSDRVGNAKIKFDNAGEFKKAFKTYAKAHASAE